MTNLEDIIIDSKLFRNSEQRALLNRLSGNRSDPHGTFAGRVKPKIVEILEWSKAEHKHALGRALMPKKRRKER